MSTLLLRSNRSFQKLLELNPSTGQCREVPGSEVSGLPPVKANGFFDTLDGVLVGIYAFERRLMLRVGERDIPLDNRVEVTLSGHSRNRKLAVQKDNENLALVEYSILDDWDPEEDPTPFIDDEDFDFGLFVANVASDPARRRVALEEW
jgi:hypothetical protein